MTATVEPSHRVVEIFGLFFDCVADIVGDVIGCVVDRFIGGVRARLLEAAAVRSRLLHKG